MNIYIPMYFADIGKKYVFFEYEKDIWASMIEKIIRYNKFLNKFIEIARKEKSSEVENLEAGKKWLPTDCIFDMILVFDRNEPYKNPMSNPLANESHFIKNLVANVALKGVLRKPNKVIKALHFNKEMDVDKILKFGIKDDWNKHNELDLAWLDE